MKDGKGAETIVYCPYNVNWPNALLSECLSLIRHSSFVDKSDELLMLGEGYKIEEFMIDLSFQTSSVQWKSARG